MEERDNCRKIVERVDPDRRNFVKRFLAGAAFAAPVLTTFAIDALSPHSANAMQSNVTSSVTPEPSTLVLMGAGAVAIGVAAHRKAQRDRKQAQSNADEQDPKE